MSSTIGVQIETGLFMQLADFLRTEGSEADPTEVVTLAIEYWLDNASWKQDDLIPNRIRGFMWKDTFLPHGTMIRIRVPSNRDYSYAKVERDKLLFEQKSVSPSEFANLATGTVRNAWRDLWIKRPDDEEWILADALRRPHQVHDLKSITSEFPAGETQERIEELAGAPGNGSYKDDILSALNHLGGTVHRRRVIQLVREIRGGRGMVIPPKFEQTVQQAFERHCVDSDIFCGDPDLALFCWPKGKGTGIWAIFIRPEN